MKISFSTLVASILRRYPPATLFLDDASAGGIAG
jgi:hypothetical protein